MVSSLFPSTSLLLSIHPFSFFSVATGHMSCFSGAIEQWDMGKCQAVMVTGLEQLQSIHLPSRQETQLCMSAPLPLLSPPLRVCMSVCRIMRQYSECISKPLRRVCGEGGWELAREMIARPTRLLMPACSLQRRPRFAFLPARDAADRPAVLRLLGLALLLGLLSL